MRIATWNVNSVRSRMEQLTAWLARAAPDVICMQETKVEDDLFPVQALEEVGYRCAFFGQKTYNGVCIGARFGLALEDVKKGMDSDAPDAQRRVIAATVEGVRIVNVYVPNGEALDSAKYPFKLDWFSRFHTEIATHYRPEQELLICGDFNVALETVDIAEPKRWEGQVLCTEPERDGVRKLLSFGLTDVFRERHPEPGHYTWWDYRMAAFAKNKGLRIDLALMTKSLAARCVDVTIDKRPRELNRPSDHAPVVVEVK
ncbi:MAG: exodeoxyribonuclease III [Minicystis sp.]